VRAVPAEQTQPTPNHPPVASTVPFTHTEHGVERADPYHWMRQRGSDALLAYLSAERAWYDASTAHLSSLVETLRTEMTSRVAPTDLSVSWKRRVSYYYTRHPAGSDYPQLLRECRKPESALSEESSESPPRDDGTSRADELLLDAATLLDESGYLELGLMVVSPDERLLAYSFDRSGDEVYRLRFRDLSTGADLEEEIPRTYYGGAWSADSDVFFYTVHDDAYRPHQVWRHAIGTPVEQDELVLEETDERFDLMLRGCRSGEVVVLWSGSRDTSEVWVVDARRPCEPPHSVGGRREGVEYHAEHAVLPGGECLLVVTNDGATEFRLAAAPVPRSADQDASVWTDLRRENPDERLERVDAFTSHVVLTLRTSGSRVLLMLPVDDLAGTGIDVRSRFHSGTIAVGPNESFDAAAVTVCEQSYVQPRVWSDVDLATGVRTERRAQEAPGHDASAYVCETLSAASADGTAVPVTVVRRRDTPLDGTAPALVYGYGAYEYVFEPEWDPALPSLLDRGVVFAHAHVRGGGEGGRRWWLEGRLGSKQHTFDDHVAVADRLEGLVDARRIASRGLSAGGLLQGAVMSQHPQRWRAVVAEVPFVDVVSTMFDASIPLTVNEWDEWGDPHDLEQFGWLMAYSPYDNVPPAGVRPNLLVTGALHDPRVMVWEPAKWVARLRATDPQWSPRCLFRCELGAGSHVGPSGRFGHLAYEAEVCAWLLDRLSETR
jgi:oligopeptidase B